MSTYQLIEGNPLEPDDYDVIYQEINLPIGELPPEWKKHDHGGWRVMTGNSNTNLWARIAYRLELEDQSK